MYSNADANHGNVVVEYNANSVQRTVRNETQNSQLQ